MNKHLEQLIALSEYDNKIASYDPKIENEKAKLQIFLEKANEINANISKISKEISELNAKKIKTDVHLKELKSKLEDVAKKTNAVSNEKEARALQLEEEIAREQISFANEEIVRFDALLGAKNVALKELTAQLAAEEANVKEMREAIGVNIAELERQRNEISEKRANLVEQIENKILTFYAKIKRWAGNSAVVAVRKQACYGCYMKINDKAYADIIKADSIVTCPHCGRIIYKPSDEE